MMSSSEGRREGEQREKVCGYEVVCVCVCVCIRVRLHIITRPHPQTHENSAQRTMYYARSFSKRVDLNEIEEEKTRMTMERAREGSDDNLIPFSDALGDAEAGGIEADDNQVSEAFGIPCML